MNKISYSQFSQWDKCPHMWKLNYVDKLGTFTDNIYTVFGTSVHETIQAYLVCYYEKTIKEADNLPLNEILKYRMEENFKSAREQNDELEITLEEMKEFFQDGLNIIEEFKKRKSGYFPKKNTELVGIEMSLGYELPKNIEFRGYIDVVIHNKKTGKVKIIDIKTATYGWNKYQKADKIKTSQMLLYKKFYSEKYDIPLDKIKVEYQILKRKISEDFEYPIPRISKFVPANGKPSVNNAWNGFLNFVNEVFDEGGNFIQREYLPNKGKQCDWCEFKTRGLCSVWK